PTPRTSGRATRKEGRRPPKPPRRSPRPACPRATTSPPMKPGRRAERPGTSGRARPALARWGRSIEPGVDEPAASRVPAGVRAARAAPGWVIPVIISFARGEPRIDITSRSPSMKTSVATFVEALLESRVLDPARQGEFVREGLANLDDPGVLADELLRRGWL